MAENLTTLKHRPLLDGIRGVFLLVVIGYHLGDPFKLPGGWVVMDLFFVLSGYLITALLIKERERSGRISLSTFYRRRIRRLGPSLLVVVAGVSAAVWIGGWSSDFPTLRSDGVATLLYFANWHFIWTHQSYFSSFHESLFRHAWSLSIEEQFYLVWPLLLLGLIWVFRRRRLLIAGFLTLCLIPTTLWIHHITVAGASLSRIHYGTDVRGPAFLVGGILALILWPNRWDTPRGQAVGSVVGTIGAVGFVLVCVYMRLSTGIYAHAAFLIGYLACAVLIFGAVRATRGPLVWVFGNRVTCHLGRISYVGYLWHWPVIVLLSPPRLNMSKPGIWVVQLLVTLVLSEITHFLVEEPIHRRRVTFRFQGRILAGSAIAVLVLVLVIPTPTTKSEPTSGGFLVQAGKPGATRVMVLGDSAAWVDAGAAPKSLPYQINLVFQARCDIVGDLVWTGDHTNRAAAGCSKWPKRWAEGISKDHPDVVFVTLGLRQLYDLDVNGRRIRLGTPEWERRYRAAVDRAVRVIRAGTDAPILWSEVPCASWAAADTAGEEHDPKRITLVNRVLADELAKFPKTQIVPYRAWVCPNHHLDWNLRPDGAHLSVPAVAVFWHRFLVPRIDAVTSTDDSSRGSAESGRNRHADAPSR